MLQATLDYCVNKVEWVKARQVFLQKNLAQKEDLEKLEVVRLDCY